MVLKRFFEGHRLSVDFLGAIVANAEEFNVAHKKNGEAGLKLPPGDRGFCFFADNQGIPERNNSRLHLADLFAEGG